MCGTLALLVLKLTFVGDNRETVVFADSTRDRRYLKGILCMGASRNFSRGDNTTDTYCLKMGIRILTHV